MQGGRRPQRLRPSGAARPRAARASDQWTAPVPPRFAMDSYKNECRGYNLHDAVEDAKLSSTASTVRPTLCVTLLR